MQIIVLLMIVSLIVSVIFLSAFIWSVRNDQYEDTYTPSLRILNDEHNIK